jgi:hypothetical protein
MDLLALFDTVKNFNPGAVFNWVNAIVFIFGLMTSPEKLAEMIVKIVRSVVPPPAKKPVIRFMNQIAKGIDKAIPDEKKNQGE